MRLVFILIVLFLALSNADHEKGHGIEQLLDQQTEMSATTFDTQKSRNLIDYNKAIKKDTVKIDIWFRALDNSFFDFVHYLWLYYRIFKDYVEFTPKYKVSYCFELGPDGKHLIYQNDKR